MSDPALLPTTRARLVAELMTARRAVRAARDDPAAMGAARTAVDVAKIALGERGPVWWNDAAPDLNRRMVAATPYTMWFAARGGCHAAMAGGALTLDAAQKAGSGPDA